MAYSCFSALPCCDCLFLCLEVVFCNFKVPSLFHPLAPYYWNIHYGQRAFLLPWSDWVLWKMCKWELLVPCKFSLFSFRLSRCITPLLRAHLVAWIASHCCNMWFWVSYAWQSPLYFMSCSALVVPLDVLAFLGRSCIPHRWRWGNIWLGYFKHKWLALSTSSVASSWPSTEVLRSFAHVWCSSVTDVMVSFPTSQGRLIDWAVVLNDFMFIMSL